jgi:membrane protein implicated in regulation of membrane protease activity
MSDQTSPAISQESELTESSEFNLRIWLVLAAIFLIILIAGLVLAVIALVRNPVATENIRDIVIIFMAVESLLIGVALIVLIVQLARLTDLLVNEVKPILDSTNETIGTIRGTTQFLSKNLVQPVVKANSSFAALRRAAELLRFRRRS